MGTILTKNYFKVRGKDMYVEIHGDAGAHPLLYLHGGPGASCYDFMLYQAERLSKHFYLIGIDQRGVLRSEPVSEDESFGVQDLVEDIEELRKQLDIPSWSILSHSFGGYLAVLYATVYPNAVEKLLYECPGFDFDLTLKSLITEAAKEFERHGDLKESQRCLTNVKSNKPTKELMHEWLEIGEKLGPDREKLYIHNADIDIFDQIFEKAPKDIQDRLPNAGMHFKKLDEEGCIYESVLPKLAKLPHEMLLIHGQYDYVFDQQQEQFYRDNLGNNRLELFKESGHFPRIEEPDKFAKLAIEFLK